MFNEAVDVVGRLVNTGSATGSIKVNGSTERREVFIHAQAVLMDEHYPDSNGDYSLLVPSFFVRQR